MSNKIRVLMVDDEPNVLSAMRRTLGRKFDITTAVGGAEGLKAIGTGDPFAVVMTDMQMPEMNGVEFLREARKAQQSAVFMMLTGNADQQTAIDAINEGQIFRFVNKPCTGEDLETAIQACARQHDLLEAERNLLGRTLTGSVKLLAEAITIADPSIGKMVVQVRSDVLTMSTDLGFGGDWRLPIAAALCFLGCITLPTPAGITALTEEDFAACVASGAGLLLHIPRLDQVAEVIGRQHETGHLPDDLDPDSSECRIVVGARLLRFAIDWYRASLWADDDRARGLAKLELSPDKYDPRLLEAAGRLLDREQNDSSQDDAAQTVAAVRIKKLTPGMVMAADVVTNSGTLLIAKGQELTPMMIERLIGFNRAGGLGGDEVNILQPADNASEQGDDARAA